MYTRPFWTIALAIRAPQEEHLMATFVPFGSSESASAGALGVSLTNVLIVVYGSGQQFRAGVIPTLTGTQRQPRGRLGRPRIGKCEVSDARKSARRDP